MNIRFRGIMEKRILAVIPALRGKGIMIYDLFDCGCVTHG